MASNDGNYDHDYIVVEVDNSTLKINQQQQNMPKPLCEISPNQPAPKPKLQAIKETDTDNQNVKMKIKPLSQKLQELQNNEAKQRKISQEMKRLRNRECARVCRMKKKLYIEQLQQRIIKLEKQNRDLIIEMQALKQLYCHPQDMEFVVYSTSTQ